MTKLLLINLNNIERVLVNVNGTLKYNIALYAHKFLTGKQKNIQTSIKKNHDTEKYSIYYIKLKLH